MITAKFDNYGIPCTVGTVVVKNIKCCDTLFVVDSEGKEHNILEASRDQWGVYYFLKDVTICQEDGTMSFIDALIKGLQYMKDRNEVTKECVVEIKEEV